MGATFIAEGGSFALFSAYAKQVEVCIFDESGEHTLNGSTSKQQAHGG